MLPVLLDLKFIKIYTFGVFLVLAFFWGSFLLWKLIRLTSYKEEEIFDGMFISLLGSLFFSRLVYVGLHFDKFGFNPLKFLLINGYPGLDLFGAIFGALLVLLIFFSTKKIKFSEAIDYFVPGLFMTLGFGKLGAFFAGVEVGTQTKLPIAMKYVNFDGMRHLTALYESILFFIGCYITYRLVFDIRREKFKKGFAFSFFCWYASLVFYVTDPIKSFRIMFFGYSLSSVISLAVLLTFSVYLLYYFRGVLFKQVAGFKNSVFKYGQTPHKKVSRTADEKTGGGEN